MNTCAFGVPGATDLSEKAVWEELETVKSVSDFGRRGVPRRCVSCRLLRQDLYFCTSKASKQSSWRLQSVEPEAQYLYLCTSKARKPSTSRVVQQKRVALEAQRQQRLSKRRTQRQRLLQHQLACSIVLLLQRL